MNKKSGKYLKMLNVDDDKQKQKLLNMENIDAYERKVAKKGEGNL